MRTFQVIILLLASGCLLAQEVEFTASVSPGVVRVGEQLNLTYTSNQELDELSVPDIHDFQLLGGPSQGHSQSVHVVNGKVTSTSVYQYTYFFRAVKEGKFTIPPATVSIKNKIYKSNAVSVEVLKAQEQQPSSSGQGRSSGDTRTSTGYGENDLYVRLVLDKRTAYIGEQILATVKIYTKTNLAGIDQAFKGPDFTGFFTEDLDTPPLRSLQREAVDNDIYYTGVIRQMVIIPQKTGELIIQPFDLDVAVRREVRRRIADPFFEDFAIPDIQEIPVKLKSKAVKINVKPLPANAPSSFKGAVGSFSLNSSISKSEVLTNEPITFKLTLRGKGNLKLINEVEVNIPYDMEKYDPVIQTHFDKALSGSKTFEYLIIPKVAGDFTIPPAEFTYFDVDTRSYKTLTTPLYDIHVEKGSGDTLMVIGSGITKEDVKLLNQDIRFIKTNAFGVKPVGYYIGHTFWYYMLYFLFLALFIAVVTIRRKMIRQNSDIAGMRLRKADKYARKRLKKSESLLKQGNDTAFFEELSGAIWGYLSDKLKIPVAQLSRDSAAASLQTRQVEQELIDQLFRITDSCEMARYALSPDAIDKNDLYRNALEIISTLQHKLK